MKITLTGKQVDIGDRLRKHVEEAIENSVNKYFNAPISCTVAFSKEGEDFNAEVTVHPAKNIVLKGSGVAGDPYSAFDNANTHIATATKTSSTTIKASSAWPNSPTKPSSPCMKPKTNWTLTSMRP